VIYTITHDKLQSVVSMEAGEARQRLFHRRALHLLQETECSATELAHHALLAEEWKEAFRYYVQAGDEAMMVFAIHNAITHYTQARTLIMAGSSNPVPLMVAPESDRLHLYEQLGRAHEFVSAWVEAQESYEAMLAEAKLAGNKEMEWNALHHLTDLGTGQVLSPQSNKPLLWAGRPIVKEHDTEEEKTKIITSSSSATHVHWNSSITYNYAQQALELARALRRQDLIALSALSFGILNLYLGRWEEAAEMVEEARILSIAMGNRALEAESLGALSSALTPCGRPQEAVHAGRTALNIGKDLGNEYTVAINTMSLVKGLIDMGTYAEAVIIARNGLVVARKLDSAPLVFLNLMTLGDAQRALLRLKEARETYIEALSVVVFPQYNGVIAADLCAIASLNEEWTEAYTWAKQAQEARNGLLLPVSDLHYWHETQALLHGGEVTQAKEGIQQLGKHIGTNRRFRVAYLRSLAVLAQHNARVEQAIDHLREAASLSLEIGLPGELRCIQAAIGVLYQKRKETEQAHKAFRDAAAVLHALAEQMQDEVLRCNFLDAPLIQHILKST